MKALHTYGLRVLAGLALGLALTTSGLAQTVVRVETYPPSNPYFFLTSGTPSSSSLTANFGATIVGASTSFNDIFEFTLPQNGTGSDSLSTSFSAPANELTIDTVLVNGISYPVTTSKGGESLTVDDIPVKDGVLNTIEVEGVTSALNKGATYTGTVTFAAAAPEPASWALMMLGVGLTGGVLRRRARTGREGRQAAALG